MKILSLIIQKKIEIIKTKNKIGYTDNSEYGIKITYKLFGITIKIITKK